MNADMRTGLNANANAGPDGVDAGAGAGTAAATGVPRAGTTTALGEPAALADAAVRKHRPGGGLRMTGKGFRALVGMQAKLLLREPAALIYIGLPLALLVIFGNIPSFQTVKAELGGRTVLDVFVPTFAAMVPLFLALTAMPSVMAMYRERNALRRFSVSPVPPAGMLAALVAVISVLALVGVGLIVAVSALFFHVTAPANAGAVVASFALGFTAFMALGLVVAAVAPSGNVAAGMGVPIMILNFFFAGLYVPTQELPTVLQRVGECIPAGAVTAAWQSEGALWQHLLVLAGYTLIGGFAAAKLFRWE